MGVTVMVFDNGDELGHGDTLVQVNYQNTTEIAHRVTVMHPDSYPVVVEIPGMETASVVINTPSLNSIVGFS